MSSEPTPARARILLVDDQSAFREQASMFLEMEGFEVKTACDGAEALDVLPGFEPDLILADVMMPRMNGFELCTAVRALERFRDTPFLFVSAQDRSAHEFDGEPPPADGFVDKPFDPDSLLAVIEQHLGRSGQGAGGEVPGPC